MKIPLSKPYLNQKEFQAVKQVLKSGWLTYGPKNQEFEKNFAEYIGVKYAVTLNSCASALFTAIKSLEITGEVILPSFTFSASANAIETAGAKPVFTEINYETGNIDLKDIERRITKKTQAIMPVHFAGQSCKMDKITALAKKRKLFIIEDSAEALGAEWQDRKTGSFGIGCFSFFPTKNITTGEGGMITTNDEKLFQKIKTLIGHGISKSTSQRVREQKPWFRAAVLAGYNFRMSNLLASLGVEQLKKLDKMNDLRRKHAAYLNKKLKDLKQIELPKEIPQAKHVYQMYTIKIRRGNRDLLVKKLKEKGIEASVHFDPPVHLQPYYQKKYGYKHGDFPITEKLSSSIITLPMFPQMTKKELDYMVSVVRNNIY
ncbi:MAG: spore coat polysaccharide biosynthesis protein SpsC [Candidatus Portnoybacteria bacterium RIFCSPLOWO2_01_FULL_43_11]|uniref:Spore coat polysaccharide biosynthesis protein SpsC n=3 Tax=Bacteria candidate phyla TaxID=1783234 RepID=A0A1G2FT83_9BACT|nr:MAG: spore coat polysaccharide biosynthesis protein SpsC [candidate division WWE3 bacterium RIFCSPHIGHO2_01_FULL_35_17]OGZ38112.1 MAG: spore coat polysaccharide biosynthesis protein SpsC [Candidatus Portnoybacteria bacterium RIFCSPLOWO2_01_FULL_43_11]OGZ40850.1 MAG: spore coat polysaccharide biosynthesis protein SpsC [Candidatus Portnoybacteria bacterium RIFCSPLOWO2_02_FULL_40_15]